MNSDFELLRHMNRRPFISWVPLRWRPPYFYRLRERRYMVSPNYFELFMEYDGRPVPLLVATDDERKELRPISPRNMQNVRLRRIAVFILREMCWPIDDSRAIVPPWRRAYSSRWNHIGHEFPDRS